MRKMRSMYNFLEKEFRKKSNVRERGKNQKTNNGSVSRKFLGIFRIFKLFRVFQAYFVY